MKIDFSLEEPFEENLNKKIQSISAAGLIDKGKISDGYHTYNELYEHRNELYFNLCFMANYYGGALVYKSKTNSDGADLDGWILVMLVGNWDSVERNLISYHLPPEYWERLDFASELEAPFFYDGHTSTDVLERLKKIKPGYDDCRVPYRENVQKVTNP